VLNQQVIDHVRIIARDLFLDSQLMRAGGDTGNRPIVIDEEVISTIFDIVGDGGLIYLSTWDDLTRIWTKIREQDDAGVATWLAFTSSEEYDKWCRHLSEAYGSFSPKSADVDKAAMEKNLAIDDDMADRLPVATEFNGLLKANPWFTYLVTLQLSLHEIFAETLKLSRQNGEG
jgi:hypothetical protein